MVLSRQQQQKDKVSMDAHTHPSANGREQDDLVSIWLADYAQLRQKTAGDEGHRSAAMLSEIKGNMAHHFTPLVESVARRFLASGEPIEDLVQEGFLGLLSALDHYDLSKGVKFSTYATHFIAGAIRHCLRDRGKIIKEPAWLHELSGKIARTNDTLTQQLGRPAQPAEIAQALNLTEEAVEEVLATRQVFHVAAFSSGSDENEESMVGLIDPEKIRSDHYVTLQLPIEDRIVLEEAAAKLKVLEQRVLHEFFFKEHNQTEIAKKLGISCNYVSHILKNSTQKLRKMMGEAEVRDRARTREASIIAVSTGLYTAAHAMARIDEELSRAARARQNAAVLLLHLSGLPASGIAREEALNLCGETVRRGLRRMDLAGRLEENSLIIFLQQTGEHATFVAERVADQLVAAGAAHRVPITVRIELAVYPAQGRTLRDLLAAAQGETIQKEAPGLAELPALRMVA